MAQIKTVKLFHPIIGVREFSEEHAANLMSIPAAVRGGWVHYEEPKSGEEEDKNAESNVADNSGNQGSHKRRKQSKREDRDRG